MLWESAQRGDHFFQGPKIRYPWPTQETSLQVLCSAFMPLQFPIGMESNLSGSSLKDGEKLTVLTV